MEVVEDEDFYPHNIAPLKKSYIIKLSDGSEYEDNNLVLAQPSLETIDDEEDSDEDSENNEEDSEGNEEESAEAELGQYY